MIDFSLVGKTFIMWKRNRKNQLRGFHTCKLVYRLISTSNQYLLTLKSKQETKKALYEVYSKRTLNIICNKWKKSINWNETWIESFPDFLLQRGEDGVQTGNRVHGIDALFPVQRPTDLHPHRISDAYLNQTKLLWQLLKGNRKAN